MGKILGIKTGTILKDPVLEIFYKEDSLNDPFINDHHAIALNIATQDELNYIYKQTLKVNQELIKIFNDININLIDFNIEIGFDSESNIILADEISPDSCRLIDQTTKEQLDKDLFRHKLGDLTNAYQEIVNRIEDKC